MSEKPVVEHDSQKSSLRPPWSPPSRAVTNAIDLPAPLLAAALHHLRHASFSPFPLAHPLVATTLPSKLLI